jgi:hypothetical protein
MRVICFGAIMLCSIQSLSARAETLDNRYQEIRSSGGLKSFCLANPQVEECAVGIGEWKPAALEKVKISAPQCFDTCPLDLFGFAKSADGSKEFPRISTKDFDGISASRGVEFELYPVALTALRYEGCTGCPLIKTSPIAASMETGSSIVQLPLVGYGTFYLPRAARSLLLSKGITDSSAEITLIFAKDKEIRRVSSKALREYAKMMQALNYAILK